MLLVDLHFAYYRCHSIIVLLKRSFGQSVSAILQIISIGKGFLALVDGLMSTTCRNQKGGRNKPINRISVFLVKGYKIGDFLFPGLKQ